MNDTQDIYGWHIIHAKTGFPYAFCLRGELSGCFTEEDVTRDMGDPEQWVLVPLVRAGSLQ